MAWKLLSKLSDLKNKDCYLEFISRSWFLWLIETLELYFYIYKDYINDYDVCELYDIYGCYIKIFFYYYFNLS